MLPQRVILGIGLAVLLIISAASISLDIKARADATRVAHTLEVINKIADARLLVRRGESAARGFAQKASDDFLRDFEEVRERLGPVFAELRQDVRDNPDQIKTLASAEDLARRRLDVSARVIDAKKANDVAAMDAMLEVAEGRGLMRQLSVKFDQMIAEEKRLLAIRTADSQRTGIVLISIDLAGASLILLLMVPLVREGRQLANRLTASKAANESLEAAVAERTEHLLAAHEGLRRSESVLKSTFQSMAEAVLVIDPRGEVLLSNPAAERMLRYRPGMNVQSLRALSQVFHADGTTPMTAEEMPAARVLRGEQFEEQEIIARPLRGAGQVHLVISGRPLRDQRGAISGAALIYHDITASRDTERRLREAQKLEAIGKLTGGVAHDFNNMLTVISGSTETLVSRLKDRPDLRAIADIIDDAASRCSALIKHLLAFARKQPLRPHNVDINRQVSEIARLLRPTLGEHIEVATILSKDVMPVLIDTSQLTNAVVNMAINARDAMPAGGKLLLETTNAVLDEADVADDPDVQAGAYVMLAMTDTGTGMSRQVLERAFEPFFTTKEVGKGTGLGLSMVYGFVKQSGGHIKIHSEEGHGTTIRLYLPPATGAVDPVAEESEGAEGGSETILVVEDDAVVRGFVISQLHALGYRTIEAQDARAALALVERGEPFDLLFTDVVMPGGMNGRELADALSRLRPGVPVLYTSGHTEDAVLHQARLDQNVLLLMKPYRRTELARMVRQALSGRRDDCL
jgi:PAS domain S-box-containing protein